MIESPVDILTSTPPRPARDALTWEDEGGGAESAPRLVSLYAPAPGLNALSFLAGAAGLERFYWAEPAGGLTVVGAGVAAEVIAPPALGEGEAGPLAVDRFEIVDARARRLFDGAILRPATGQTPDAPAAERLARPRLLGGFAFQDDFVPDNTWSVFSPAHFVLPHYQLAQWGDATFLTINALIGPDEPLAESLAALREALDARLALPVAVAPARPLERPWLRYPLSAGEWRAMVERATDLIHAGELDKVVLARVCEVRADEPIDAAMALEFLNSHYGDSYRFLFEPQPGHAFFGATPELLVEKTGGGMRTMALAGSIGRGRTGAQDDTLAAQLLASTKDRHEHLLVSDAIRHSLAPLTHDIAVAAEPTVLRLRNIQHLLTPISARLDDAEAGILPLARALHPTPAMGGAPRERALALLRHLEPVPRGWYAAPIGWLDSAGDGVFAVAIRSAVTQHNRAWLYAGAGIVGDSQPEREWAETALKFRPMLGALGVEETA
ncbi:isochorismate synthase MenF [Promineifilum sp.]|uniref:isochorismate synthase n=1 Tax=Promineifilum sp. TaxID=2664178 RepID=UPI0035B227A0